MNEPRFQHLSEAFNSIIMMLLGSLRAQGWRCLLDLPGLWRQIREVRRWGRELKALFAALRDGTLVPAAPAPAVEELPEPDDTYAWESEAPRQAARSEPAARDRPRVAARRSPPQADAGPELRRDADDAAALPNVGGEIVVRPWRFRRPPEIRFTLPGLRAIASGRSF